MDDKLKIPVTLAATFVDRFENNSALYPVIGTESDNPARIQGIHTACPPISCGSRRFNIEQPEKPPENPAVCPPPPRGLEMGKR